MMWIMIRMLLTASLLQRCMSKLIGFIDADHMGKDLSKCFPNLPLMKLSAFHKSMGDKCEWVNYRHIYDLVYCSKVFSFTREIQAPIRANRIITGGSGYSIKLERERERVLILSIILISLMKLNTFILIIHCMESLILPMVFYPEDAQEDVLSAM